MKKLITFVIPILHPENCRDWAELKRELGMAIGSIGAQKNNDWEAVVVANHGSDLPELPSNFRVVWVDYGPNRYFEKSSVSKDQFRNSIRFDKGRRVLAGLLTARESEYVMFVDHDDLVSRDITSFLANNCGEPGWFIQDGYLWASNSRMLFMYHGFSNLCGTSLIIKSDLFALPDRVEDADPEYICKMLGSHIFIRGHLAEMGKPLKPLPFYGAVYRIGHSNAHSKSGKLLRTVFINRNVLKNPLRVFSNIAKFRYLSSSLRREFLGE